MEEEIKIYEAMYKIDGKPKYIFLKDLTKELYKKQYRGILYCPEPGCNAKLSFIENFKHTKFFKRFPSTPHAEGCQYAGDENNTNDKHVSSYEHVAYNLHKNHIQDVLSRAFKSFKDGKIINLEERGGNNHRSDLKKSKNETCHSSSKDPALFNSGIDSEENGKNPYIHKKLYNEITADDAFKIRCIIGYVDTMQILTEKEHAYINLTKKSKNSVKVCLPPQFKKAYINEFEKLHIINDYIRLMKEKKEKAVCCCVGMIKFVPTGINIYVDRPEGFTLNGLPFYSVVFYMDDYNYLQNKTIGIMKGDVL